MKIESTEDSRFRLIIYNYTQEVNLTLGLDLYPKRDPSMIATAKRVCAMGESQTGYQ